MKCPLVNKLTPLGCLLNKIKHDSCAGCPGLDGHLDHVAGVREQLARMVPDDGLFVPTGSEKLKVLKEKGVTPEHVAGWLDLFLAGDLCQRVEVIDPIAKSRVRP